MSGICYPRIKKVVKLYKNGAKFYKTAFIGKNNILNATDQDKIELAHNAGELLAIAENTLELTKQNKFYQLFEDGNKEKYTAVYFREELDKFDEFTEMVRKLKRQMTVYIFIYFYLQIIDKICFAWSVLKCFQQLPKVHLHYEQVQFYPGRLHLRYCFYQ